MQTIGDRLALLRIEQNMTMEQVAKAIGVTKASVSRWETGERTPRKEYIQAYAYYFDTSVDWILNGDEEVDLNKRLDLIEQKLDLILSILQGGK